MERRIVSIALRYRFFVVLAIALIAGWGVYAYRQLPIDAFPDISPIMVPIFAEAHGMAPEEIERLITFPIESAMNGLPGVAQVKSTSAAGMAVVYVYFSDDTDIYFARQIVAERLGQAMAELPELHEPPKLGPIATGLGQIFMYYLTLAPNADTEGKDAGTYLREINDWIVKYQLRTVPGVTDILSMGGFVLQYEIRINPHALDKYGLSIAQVVEAVRANNRNAGGQFLLLGSEEYNIRGVGLLQSLEDIRGVQIAVRNGAPIRIGDVAEVAYGRETRRGVVTRNGAGEVVTGIVLQLFGENTSKVIASLYRTIPAVQASLPPGVRLVPYYEQAELVRKATRTVIDALWQGALLVIIILTLFLGNLRTSFIVSLALPLCALIAIIGMRLTGLSANLMSLGGIAIAVGMLGDGAIVMVENVHRHLVHGDADVDRSVHDVILAAAREVVRPIVFSIAIIVTVFLPIFALQGVEGKMFRPMASTLTFALLASMLVAAVFAPALCTYLLTRVRAQKDFFLLHWLKRAYLPLLRIAVRRRRLVLLAVIVMVGITALILPRLGTEFIPTLEEGSILLGVTMAPSISLEQATATIQALERRIMAHPEVAEVISRVGRPEAGSHPHPVNTGEIQIALTPLQQWRRVRTKKALVELLSRDLASYPGVSLNFTQPIQNAFDELLSGAKAQLAIKVVGEDLEVLRTTATAIRNAIDAIPGLVDVAAEQNFGQPQIQVIADRAACARFGVNVNEILELVELAIGGDIVDQMYLNTRRFGIQVRYQERYRRDPGVIGNLRVQTANGAIVPLKQVATVKSSIGPIQINRENNQRYWTIFGNIRGRDLGSVVNDIRERIAGAVTLPPGYYVEYGGQFENQQRAMMRLAIIVPIAFGLVFMMLCLALGSLRAGLLIMVNVPLALIGGVIGLYLTGGYLSVPAAVGFIALFGIAVQNGLVLVTCINDLRRDGLLLQHAILDGCLQRLRPVLMTASTTIAGLLPLLFARGIGAEVQKPLAIVVTFGLASATCLTLLVIPAFYTWFAPSVLERRRAT